MSPTIVESLMQAKDDDVGDSVIFTEASSHVGLRARIKRSKDIHISSFQKCSFNLFGTHYFLDSFLCLSLISYRQQSINNIRKM